MHTPAIALAWEFWRRNRTRLMIIMGIVLGFVFVYPKLCALAGFNPDRDALDEFSKMLGPLDSGQPALGGVRIVRVMYALSLAAGPGAAMVMTLLVMTWISTFVEFDPKTRDPITFPGRKFALPVSTNFLFLWHFLTGTGAVAGLYALWVFFVRLPHMEIFGPFQNGFGWITLLAVWQGIAWALAAWPNTKAILLAAVFFGFIWLSSRPEVFSSPLLLAPLFLIGTTLARAGLQKMRHGQWQGYSWRPFRTMAPVKALGRQERFASPARAQLWFEWRRLARGISFLTVALVCVPIVLLLMARTMGFVGRLSEETLYGITAALIGLLLIIYFCFSLSSDRTDQSFLMVRPLTDGEMVMAMLKAAAVSAVLTWVAVGVALSFMPLLGDFHLAERNVSVFPGFSVAIVLGLIFLTWRMVAVNLCFVLAGNEWFAGAAVLLMVAACGAGANVISVLQQDQAHWSWFWRFLPKLLAFLVAVKFLPAFLVFRVALKRRLLAPSALLGYLAVWFWLVAGWLTALLLLSHLDKELILPVLPLSLAIVLLVPLARIGFCPIALAGDRHT